MIGIKQVEQGQGRALQFGNRRAAVMVEVDRLDELVGSIGRLRAEAAQPAEAARRDHAVMIAVQPVEHRASCGAELVSRDAPVMVRIGAIEERAAVFAACGMRRVLQQEEERGKQLRLAEERCRKGRALPTDNCAAVRQR